jgi:DNA-directed RNA polymerase subunit RPC12/RpoP
MSGVVHTSFSAETECPTCGSVEVFDLPIVPGLFRCIECGEHFEEPDERRIAPPRAFSRRKMRHNKYREDE